MVGAAATPTKIFHTFRIWGPRKTKISKNELKMSKQNSVETLVSNGRAHAFYVVNDRLLVPTPPTLRGTADSLERRQKRAPLGCVPRRSTRSPTRRWPIASRKSPLRFAERTRERTNERLSGTLPSPPSHNPRARWDSERIFSLQKDRKSWRNVCPNSRCSLLIATSSDAPW